MSRQAGTVKFFNTQKGYGFIVSGEQEEQPGQEYFVHFSAISGDGFKSLAAGEDVEFELDTNQTTGKLCAVNVTGPNGAAVQGAPPQMMKGGGKGGKGGKGGYQVADYGDGGKGFNSKGFSGGKSGFGGGGKAFGGGSKGGKGGKGKGAVSL
mmetsp:Transcript_437/g.489  ORF Transcript_437/g.489 Transcript_437/m.489 type:complete len:152 (+) Transcript_437:119-574(+)